MALRRGQLHHIGILILTTVVVYVLYQRFAGDIWTDRFQNHFIKSKKDSYKLIGVGANETKLKIPLNVMSILRTQTKPLVESRNDIENVLTFFDKEIAVHNINGSELCVETRIEV